MEDYRIHWANDLLDLYPGKGAGVSSCSHTGPSSLLQLKDKPQLVINTGFISKALQILEGKLIKGISRDFIMAEAVISSTEGACGLGGTSTHCSV